MVNSLGLFSGDANRNASIVHGALPEPPGTLLVGFVLLFLGLRLRRR